MPKKIASKTGCDSFDQLDLQSLDDYKGWSIEPPQNSDAVLFGMVFLLVVP
jgi:hypothetical protein